MVDWQLSSQENKVNLNVLIRCDIIWNSTACYLYTVPKAQPRELSWQL